MSDSEPSVDPAWRQAAALAGFAWLITSIGLLILELSGNTTGPYAAWAFPVALTAGVPVLTLLKFVGNLIAGDGSPNPAAMRISLWLGVGMMALAWVAYLL